MLKQEAEKCMTGPSWFSWWDNLLRLVQSHPPIRIHMHALPLLAEAAPRQALLTRLTALLSCFPLSTSAHTCASSLAQLDGFVK